ncbi:hypothetical protein [Streptomyces sp. NPDC000983]|uniref:hypothetical protein n=1 Tax=Streptomyces sp. NPDC000983 TaxID=3154373 RepID=UPI003320AA98
MVDMELLPYGLTWPEVDPATHPFDNATAHDTVRALASAGRLPVRPPRRATSDRDEMYEDYRKLCQWARDEGWDWCRAVTEDLVARYGSWSTGWRWSHDEGDLSGGPVGGWCCALHSITDPDETFDRVAASLCEWRDWLEFLGRFFDRYPLTGLSADDRRDVWERATQQLILHCLDRTGSGDAWYAHCHQVLTWFLTRWEVDPDTARTLVEDAVGGRFGSWTAPDVTVVTSVAEQLATSLEPDATPAPGPEAYTWTSARLHSYLDE